MKHIGGIKPDNVVTILNWVGIPLIIIYLFCMFLYPLLSGGCDWGHVQDVWNNWQPLNVGMLAFTSSIIAFKISIFNADRQRERDFVAVKAFLPEALSELTAYFKLCASILKEAWQRANEEAIKKPLQTNTPSLPLGYREIFSRCIGFAEPDVGEHLVHILMRLQVHDSRIKELSDSFGKDSTMMILPQNVISYLFSLAELQALVNRTFRFARGLEALDSSKYVWEDYRNAYGNLGIMPGEFDDLIDFTERTIDRSN